MKLFSGLLLFNNANARKEVSTLSKSSSVRGSDAAAPSIPETKTTAAAAPPSPNDSSPPTTSNRRIVFLEGDTSMEDRGVERRNSTTFEQIFKESNIKPTVMEAPRKRTERKSVSLSFHTMAVRRQTGGASSSILPADEDEDAIGIDDDSDAEDGYMEDVGGDHQTADSKESGAGGGYAVHSSSSHSSSSSPSSSNSASSSPSSSHSSSSHSASSSPSSSSPPSSKPVLPSSSGRSRTATPEAPPSPLSKAPLTSLTGGGGSAGGNEALKLPPSAMSTSAGRPFSTVSSVSSTASLSSSSSASRISRSISGRFLALAQSVMPVLASENSANVPSNLSEVVEDSGIFNNPNPMLARQQRTISASGFGTVAALPAGAATTATSTTAGGGKNDKGGGRSAAGARPPSVNLEATSIAGSTTGQSKAQPPTRKGASNAMQPPQSSTKTALAAAAQGKAALDDVREGREGECSDTGDEEGGGEVERDTAAGGRNTVATDPHGKEETPRSIPPVSEDIAPPQSAPEKKPFQLVDRCLLGAHNRDLGIALVLPAAPKRAIKNDDALANAATVCVAPPPPFGAASIVKIHGSASSSSSLSQEGDKLHGINRALLQTGPSAAAGGKGAASSSSSASSNQGAGKTMLPPARPRKFAANADQEKVGWG